MCSLMINGVAHGPERATTTCQLHMRHFKDGDTIVSEPWRAKAFPIPKDLIVDRSSFDRIIQSGGYISVSTGSAPDANALPVSKRDADRAMDAAACIGCGACVAACPNVAMPPRQNYASFLSPQGQTERFSRAVLMVNQMDAEGWRLHQHRRMRSGLPQGSARLISHMNGDLLAAFMGLSGEASGGGAG